MPQIWCANIKPFCQFAKYAGLHHHKWFTFPPCATEVIFLLVYQQLLLPGHHTWKQIQFLLNTEWLGGEEMKHQKHLPFQKIRIKREVWIQLVFEGEVHQQGICGFCCHWKKHSVVPLNDGVTENNFMLSAMWKYQWRTKEFESVESQRKWMSVQVVTFYKNVASNKWMRVKLPP